MNDRDQLHSVELHIRLLMEAIERKRRENDAGVQLSEGSASAIVRCLKDYRDELADRLPK